MSIGLLIETGKSLTKFQSDIVSVDLDVTLDESHEWLNDVVTNGTLPKGDDPGWSIYK